MVLTGFQHETTGRATCARAYVLARTNSGLILFIFTSSLIASYSPHFITSLNQLIRAEQAAAGFSNHNFPSAATASVSSSSGGVRTVRGGLGTVTESTPAVLRGARQHKMIPGGHGVSSLSLFGPLNLSANSTPLKAPSPFSETQYEAGQGANVSPNQTKGVGIFSRFLGGTSL
jgi:hypothetical protein